MAEIGEPERRRVLVPELPETPAPMPIVEPRREEPVKVPEKGAGMSFNFLSMRSGDKMEVGTQKAYRFWRYVFQPDIALLSWVASTRWYPGHYVEATSPDVGEQGIHGFKTMDDLMFSLRFSPEGYVVRAKITQCDGIVIGEVSLWGVIWEHTKGYRAEFAKPLSFISAHGNRADEALQELRNSYIK